MPGYVQHIVFGLFFAMAAFFALAFFGVHLGPNLRILCVLLAAVFSVFPDIDNRRAKVYSVYELGVFLLVSALLVAELSGSLGLMAFALVGWGLTHRTIIAAIKPRHRGITHDVLTAVIVSSLMGLASLLFLETAIPGAFVLAGYVSHIMADNL